MDKFAPKFCSSEPMVYEPCRESLLLRVCGVTLKDTCKPTGSATNIG